MGWELRKGRRYYYLKVRREGKVVSVYLGNGPAAQAFDAMAKVQADWLALKYRAKADGVEIDPYLLNLGDAVFNNRRRKKRRL